MPRRWTCVLGHRIEADSEEELVRRVQEHMAREHGVEIPADRIRRELREEE
jgi:predicted small metal-binding protein